ncbi:MAG: hypothetical protein M3N14_01215, partial [Bacteroidota bacterium]|nr:hypothetical protein [Bacteroidota bacterium]
DDKGIFHFTNLNFVDTCHFILSGVNKSGSNSTQIVDLNSNQNPQVLSSQSENKRQVTDAAMATYVMNDKSQQRNIANYFNRKAITLKQVNIKAAKRNDQYETQSFAGAGNADQVLHSAELGYGPLVSKLNGVLRGVSFIKDTAYLTLNLMNAMPNRPPHKMLVIVDGVEGSELTGLQATDVETVELLKNASASMYGMEGAHGVLIITTRKRRQLNPKDIASAGVLAIAPMGFYKAREFYSPEYQNTTSISHPDMRSTIYWKPELTTDKDGNAFFEYYNADGVGTYRITIEGIDDSGNIGRTVFRYSVK